MTTPTSQPYGKGSKTCKHGLLPRVCPTCKLTCEPLLRKRIAELEAERDAYKTQWDAWQATAFQHVETIQRLEAERDGLASYVVDLGITDAPSAEALPEVQHAIAIARERKLVCEAASVFLRTTGYVDLSRMGEAVAKLREVENDRVERR